MKKLQLDKEDKELIKFYENNEFVTAKNAKALMKKAVAMAKAMPKAKKNKVVTFRLPESDLNLLKIKASNQGLPYQTLLASLIHQYTNDKVKLK